MNTVNQTPKKKPLLILKNGITIEFKDDTQLNKFYCDEKLKLSEVERVIK